MSVLTTTRPAAPYADTKARLAAAVEAARTEILELSHRIHADPEPAYEEHHAAAWVAEALTRHGFEVQAPAGSLATAIRAVKRGGGGDGRSGLAGIPRGVANVVAGEGPVLPSARRPAGRRSRTGGAPSETDPSDR